MGHTASDRFGASDGSDRYVGVFMVEQPDDWWLPPGYTLTPTGGVGGLAESPAGRMCLIYPVPGYRPSPARVDSIASVIERELGPVPMGGMSPAVHEALGMNRPDLLGTVNRTIMAPVDAAVMLLDLAGYGISASVVGVTEGASRAGWLSETSAGQLRRDLNLLALVSTMEASASPAPVLAKARSAQLGVAMAARSAASILPAIVIRFEQRTGLPFGRMFRVFEVVEADELAPGQQARTVRKWLARMQAGREFDRSQEARYRFNQLHVVKERGSGYWILDSYGPLDPSLGAGPVSREFTQLADIELQSARRMLREAHYKYRPGRGFADVPSRPNALTDVFIKGKLWLAVPVQSKAVPPQLLAVAKELGIAIRDITGKVY